MIKLNLTQPTFEKYLYSYGYNYKIKQFSDFIQAIKRITFKKITEDENLAKNWINIFNTMPQLSIMFDKENILNIRKDFLIELIENSELDLYLEEKPEIYSKRQMKYAYFLELGRKQDHDDFNNKVIKPLLRRIDLISIKGRKCFQNNAIELTNKEKEVEKIEFYKLFYKVIYHNFHSNNGKRIKIHTELDKFHKYLDAIDDYQDIIAKLFYKEDFLFDKDNYFEISYNTHVENIFKALENYVYKNTILTTLKEICDKPDMSIQEIYHSFTFLTPFLTPSNEKEIVKILLVIKNITKKDLYDISIKFSNNRNTIEYTLDELNYLN